MFTKRHTESPLLLIVESVAVLNTSHLPYYSALEKKEKEKWKHWPIFSPGRYSDLLAQWHFVCEFVCLWMCERGQRLKACVCPPEQRTLCQESAPKTSEFIGVGGRAGSPALTQNAQTLGVQAHRSRSMLAGLRLPSRTCLPASIPSCKCH